tara:strand:+ start:3675 stop:5012 length:1338 start_codon:yes stop_codon:yes gene_type:complete
MKNNINIKLVVHFTGLFILIIGLIFNEWLLSIFTVDGIIEQRKLIIVRSFNFIFIVLGLLILLLNFKSTDLAINIFIGFIFSVTFFILGEFALRILQKNKNMFDVDSVMIANPNNTGSHRLKPNFERTLAKKYLIKTNSFGMHWKELKKEKNNKKRIAFIGDSFTFGQWAYKVEKSFVGIFDSLINDKDFEVLNFGVGGYGYDDMKLILEEEILSFKPDYLFLMTFNGNDMRDTYLGLNKFIFKSDGLHFDTDNIKNLIPYEHTRGYRNKLIEDKHSLFEKILNAYKKYSHTFKIIDSTIRKYAHNSNFKVSSSFRDYTFWSKKQYPDVAIKAKNLSIKILSDIKQICDKNNLKLIIASIPFANQVYSEDKIGIDYNIDFPQKYIENFSNENYIPYYDLLDPLRLKIKLTRESLYLDNDPHFNEVGHKFTGELLYDFFNKNFITK